MTPLQIAIEGLYEAFKNARAPKALEGCSCCTDPERLAKIGGSARRAISIEEICYYASKAMTTIGGVDDFLYFLPRILEVLAQESELPILQAAVCPQIDATARRIVDTRLNEWPATRLQALHRYFQAMLDSILAKQAYDRLGGWIGAMAIVGVDISPCLKHIEENHREAVLYLFEDYAAFGKGARATTSYWEQQYAGHDAYSNWMQSVGVRKILKEEWGYSG